MTITLGKGLALAALVLFVIATVLCFIGSDVSQLHILGFFGAGWCCMAAAAVAP